MKNECFGSDDWVLYEISEAKKSLKKDEDYFILYFYNVNINKKYMTYITIGHRNNEWWAPLILNNKFGVYNFRGLKTKTSNGRTLIDGDSIPVLDMELTHNEANTISNASDGQKLELGKEDDTFSTIFN